MTYSCFSKTTQRGHLVPIVSFDSSNFHTHSMAKVDVWGGGVRVRNIQWAAMVMSRGQVPCPITLSLFFQMTNEWSKVER